MLKHHTNLISEWKNAPNYYSYTIRTHKRLNNLIISSNTAAFTDRCLQTNPVCVVFRSPCSRTPEERNRRNLPLRERPLYWYDALIFFIQTHTCYLSPPAQLLDFFWITSTILFSTFPKSLSLLFADSVCEVFFSYSLHFEKYFLWSIHKFFLYTYHFAQRLFLNSVWCLELWSLWNGAVAWHWITMLSLHETYICEGKTKTFLIYFLLRYLKKVLRVHESKLSEYL